MERYPMEGSQAARTLGVTGSFGSQPTQAPGFPEAIPWGKAVKGDEAQSNIAPG